MHSEATNPYATPKTDACLPEAKIVRENLPIIPPLALWRLAVALVLLTIGWVALWAQVNDHFLFGILIPVICWQRIPKLLNPHGLRRNGGSNLWHGNFPIICSAVFIGLIFFGERLPDPAKEALKHPVAFGFGGLVSYGFILSDWWMRRNNPPYQSKPHAELPSESPWKPLPRVSDP